MNDFEEMIQKPIAFALGAIRCRSKLLPLLAVGIAVLFIAACEESVPANKPPVAYSAIPSLTISHAQASETIRLSRYFRDPDDYDTLTYTAESSDTAVATVTVYYDDTLRITAVGLGTATIRVIATDSDQASVSQSFRVTVVGTVPSFGARTVADQSFTIGTAITPVVLPEATGDDGRLAYSLAPTVPGLGFSAATRTLSGTPTASGTHFMTYRVVDGDGDAATLTFSIRVAAPDMEPSFGTETVPDQSFAVGTAITPLVLPEATGGDGRLTYSLAPTVPGLEFSVATRTLSGTPTASGTHSMTYRAVDGDGDSATLSFVIRVEAYYGAIVAGRGVGISWRNTSKSGAIANATDDCNERARTTTTPVGYNDGVCADQMWFRACGAIAVINRPPGASSSWESGWAMRWADSKTAAEHAALDSCQTVSRGRGCEIWASVCASDEPNVIAYKQPKGLILQADPIRVVPPAGLRLKFSVRQDNGLALQDQYGEFVQLTKNDITVVNDINGIEFGETFESGSESEPGLPSDFHLLTVFALDFSRSIFRNAVEDEIEEGVSTYLESLLEPATGDSEITQRIKEQHEVAIVQIGATKHVKLVQDFTDDSSQVKARVSQMVAAGELGSTNLYDGYTLAIETARNKLLRDRLDQQLTRVTIVVFTDGVHEAGAHRLSNPENLRRYKDSVRGFDIFVVVLESGLSPGREQEYLAKLEELSSGSEFLVRAEDSEMVVDKFSAVAKNVDYLARSNYVIGICTPVSEGEASLTLHVEKIINGIVHSGAKTLPYETSNLTGELSSCDEEIIARS